MRAEKQLLLDEIKEWIENSKAFVVASYQGIEANSTADFRKAIVDTGGDVKVIGKRIFLRAAKEAKIEFSREELEGHIALVFACEDPIQTTKALCDFQKAQKNKVAIHGGFFDQKKTSKDDILEISKLPSMDQMRAEIIGLLTAPMTQTLGVIQAVLAAVPSCLDQKVKKQEN